MKSFMALRAYTLALRAYIWNEYNRYGICWTQNLEETPGLLIAHQHTVFL